MDIESGTGKTRLKYLLDTLHGYGEPVCTYTYNDYLHDTSLEDCLNPNKFKVLLIDRYTLFYPFGTDLIEAQANNMIILLDCKNGLPVPYSQFAFIEMEPNIVRVLT